MMHAQMKSLIESGLRPSTTQAQWVLQRGHRDVRSVDDDSQLGASSSHFFCQLLSSSVTAVLERRK